MSHREHGQVSVAHDVEFVAWKNGQPSLRIDSISSTIILSLKIRFGEGHSVDGLFGPCVCGIDLVGPTDLALAHAQV